MFGRDLAIYTQSGNQKTWVTTCPSVVCNKKGWISGTCDNIDTTNVHQSEILFNFKKRVLLNYYIFLIILNFCSPIVLTGINHWAVLFIFNNN